FLLRPHGWRHRRPQNLRPKFLRSFRHDQLRLRRIAPAYLSSANGGPSAPVLLFARHNLAPKIFPSPRQEIRPSFVSPVVIHTRALRSGTRAGEWLRRPTPRGKTPGASVRARP